MTGGSLFRQAKKVICRGRSSRGESSGTSDDPSTPVQPTSAEGSDRSSQPRQSFHSDTRPTAQPDEGAWLIDQQGKAVRRRGRTTCADIQSLPPGTRIHIEINENGIPCNIPESSLLGSYMGVIARDPVLAPIGFSDWRNKAMEPFKKKMLAEVEAKFEFPGHIRQWIMQSLGVKWRNYKTSLKAEHWDSRSVEEIMEEVPEGVDAAQWCQLVSQWSQPEDRERAARNTENAKKQTCPHTMGRISSVRRQKEMCIQDRLLLWKANRVHKDGSWASEDARLRWAQVCEILAAEGLTPEDANTDANERVFALVMGPEHPGRVRTQGFGVTPTRYFPQCHGSTGESSGTSNFARVSQLEEEIQSLRSEVNEMRDFRSQMNTFMQQFQSQNPNPGGSSTGGDS